MANTVFHMGSDFSSTALAWKVLFTMLLFCFPISLPLALIWTHNSQRKCEYSLRGS